VKKYLQELIKTEYIKQIGKDKGKNVYVYNKNRNANTVYKVNQKHYTLESIQETYRRQIQKRRELFDDLL
jgi:phosphoribosylamine-glycine ligase